jgi:hypothetical protein
VLDSSVDWRGRLLDIQVVGVANANELPQQVNYDPNLPAGTWDMNPSFYTADGATSVAVPVGTRWNPPSIANVYIFAANTAAGGVAIGNLALSNQGGGAIYIMVKVMRTSDVR